MHWKDMPAPDTIIIELFITDHCTYCKGMLDNCIMLLKKGVFSCLRICNVETDPALLPNGYRTVPILRINTMIFNGLLESDEIRNWVNLEKEQQATTAYIDRLLKLGKLDETQRYLEQETGRYASLLDLLSDPDTGVSVKLGISALLEDKTGTEVLQRELFPRLIELANHNDQNIRGDACYFLGLSQNPLALPALNEKLQDTSPDVREIAQEAIEQIELNQ